MKLENFEVNDTSDTPGTPRNLQFLRARDGSLDTSGTAYSFADSANYPGVTRLAAVSYG